MLQVIVVAHDQEAELEVQTDAWSSYEELRELVVDAVPNMFRDSNDPLTASLITPRRSRTVCIFTRSRHMRPLPCTCASQPTS